MTPHLRAHLARLSLSVLALVASHGTAVAVASGPSVAALPTPAAPAPASAPASSAQGGPVPSGALPAVSPAGPGSPSSPARAATPTEPVAPSAPQATPSPTGPTAAAPRPVTSPAPLPPRSARSARTGRVVVKLADSRGTTEQRRAALSRAAAGVGWAADSGTPTATGAVVLPATGADPEEAARRLRSQPGVAYAEAERWLTPSATNDPGYPQQWDLPVLGVPQAWSTTTGAGVTVAVLDTGSLAHPDMTGRYLPGYDLVSDPASAQDGNGRDPDPTDPGDWAPDGACGGSPATTSSWHGLHVASTIAAIANNGIGTAGIAPASTILPVRVMGRCGGTDTDIMDGLVWAAGGSVPGLPANPRPAKIINLSLGGPGPCTAQEQEAIDLVLARGALVVAAAGNDGGDVADYTPANCRGVVAVAATTSTGARASFSNAGPGIALAAPGVGIYGLGNGGTRGIDQQRWSIVARSGTSMAAPHVSAVAALMLAASPTLTAGRIRDLLESTARPAASAGMGYGVIDAAAAIAAARASIAAAPVVSSLSVPGARLAGGDLVRIQGSNLGGATVTIGGRLARVDTSGATQLTIVTPAGERAGLTQLVVTTSGGQVRVAFFLEERYVFSRDGVRVTPTP